MFTRQPIIHSLSICTSLLLFQTASHASTVFDFVRTGGSNANNSQNSGNGNFTNDNSTDVSASQTLDGITLTVTADAPTDSFISANTQGWGVRTGDERGTENIRVEGDKDESLLISFDTAVTLDSLRLGNLGAGKTITISLVSGADPFLPLGSSLSIAGSADPFEDLLLATDTRVTGALGTIAPATVLRISVNDTADFLLNELTVSIPSVPDVDPLITAISTDQSAQETTLTWNGESGRSYSIEASDDLVTWETPVSSVTSTGPDTIHTFIDADIATTDRRFYRVVLLP